MKLQQALLEEIKGNLNENGFKVSTLAGSRAAELCGEIKARSAEGQIDTSVSQRYLSGIIAGPGGELRADGTLFVIAHPFPITRYTFCSDRGPRQVLVPPTYVGLLSMRDKALEQLNQVLGFAGFQARWIHLPSKLAAVRSGLAQYGRNNISYIQGLGSFYGILTFYSDFPISEDHWQPARMMERCQSCKVCLKACPVQAISSERFLIHAEKCLTFHNESDQPFPGWLDEGWHNSLVGCLHCQAKCPENRAVRGWVEDGGEFSAGETGLILQNENSSAYPEELTRKLEKFDLLEYREYLGRNLRAVL
jgi:epoxyqueuosine reductase